MKLISAIFLLLLFESTLSFDTCWLCSGFLSIPKTWVNAKELLNLVCPRLGSAEQECHGIVEKADLTPSYPNMYPDIVNLRNFKSLGNSCILCSEIFVVPETWEDASKFLMFVCDRFQGRIAKACRGIVINTELDESYPMMYPHIMRLRRIACAKYCRKDDNSNNATTTVSP